MTGQSLDPMDAELTLFVAGRGVPPKAGLYRYHRTGGDWRGRLNVGVTDLAALASHPSQQILYGIAGVEDGMLHAWQVSGEEVHEIEAIKTGGQEPCHIAVDPRGRFLAVTNYASGTLAIQRLGTDGRFQGSIQVISFSGCGSDPERQEASHPHQAVFQGNALHVIDLGTDCVRNFEVSSAGPVLRIDPVGFTPVPSGTGPRHLTVLPDGSFVLTGELASTVLACAPSRAESDWVVLPSTGRTGPARTRQGRNYPGDIKGSLDGTKVYCANRGYDTISTYNAQGGSLQMISERKVNAAWPQHMLVTADSLFVASWDSSLVSALPLRDGIPRAARPQFKCEGASWLLAQPAWWQ